MFRKSRDDGSCDLLQPYVGRRLSPERLMTTHAPPQPNISTSTPPSVRRTPTMGGATATRTPAQLRRGKSNAKPNGSILNFFKKAEPVKNGTRTSSGAAANDISVTNDDDDLFVPGNDEEVIPRRERQLDGLDTIFPRSSENDFDIIDRAGIEAQCMSDSRFNEDARPVKRHCAGPRSPLSVAANESRHSGDGLESLSAVKRSETASNKSPANSKHAQLARVADRDCSASPKQSLDSPVSFSGPASTDVGLNDLQEEAVDGLRHAARQSKPLGRLNPFADESDSDEGLFEHVQTNNGPPNGAHERTPVNNDPHASSGPEETDDKALSNPSPAKATFLEQEVTEPSANGDEWDTLDLEETEFGEGEEYLERQLAEEELRAEMAENGIDEDEMDEMISTYRSQKEPTTDEEKAADAQGNQTSEACPICDGSLDGLSHDDAQLHVNHCLDGTPLPLPKPTKPSPSATSTLNANRFHRPARPAKPGQASPFSFGAEKSASSSAFSKLMSSHAEDAAWATAAAAEHAARGKPAFKRTCPFYKILPGLSICVDAFRYGAVEGCQAYFLSHFHSDHYVGLTSTWTHGPIYCSRVTGNLVRQQLRVDPRFVVDLEFERQVEVPGTQGVQVTMIPANHCPGSSLFLFEKTIGRGKSPKVHRVLHCGDFRACPAHVRHPLLRPDLLDASGVKVIGQQKIDVCYLDTTYLNPKYAFPSQEQVIGACADMCVSLRKEFKDDNDDWERVKRLRAGSGMVKFIDAASEPATKQECRDHINAMSVDAKPNGKSRGRLLVVVGTYSIGKERICMGIARALDCKIFAPPGKQRICACLEDDELNSRLTSDPYEAQVHMTPLFEIRAETLQDYLDAYKPHFSRVVGFRPSGWNYKPPNSRFVESPGVQTVLQSANWRSSYSMADLMPQRGSTREASCFGVPYSEHSSFRELTMFCCALRIDKIIPTVNVGSARSREKMKAWFDKWAMEKKKNGLYTIRPDRQEW